ncbi:hypothetical protein BU14_0052s0008 [Porphyra umbilicalis]|uniref:Uncharacterized protein n=1 Tax=Porphyra umbilicalis TaxID=2786 RepID=A0A1X6PHR9_PORUM|nr:hypothetical protein BU14_0052s0008 [Porphyra umbilicalis]|eukprot:OSX80392.1 hypothetical protein BU14_0052s0008 [Porphyra umbilicalis]
MFATMANESLSEPFDSSERVFLSLAALRKLRMEYDHITYKALHGRVWNPAPSGAIGVVLCFSAPGSRDKNGQHQLLVATASLEGEEVVFTCSEEERRLGDGGCSLRAPMRAAVERVRRAMDVTLANLFEVLGRAVIKRRLTSDVTCNHASSALAAAKAVEDGTETGSETEETEEDEADLLSLVKSDPAKYQEASGAVEGPPHLPSATLPFVPVNRAKWRARSNESWYLVPPLVAHRERAELMRALRDPSHRVSYPAGAQCPYYGVGRASKTPLRDKVATVELEDGVLLAAVKVWRFHKCLYRVLPDGKARGVVFSSLCTAYSEAFLFKVAVNLARNGGSLHSTACLREAFVDLHTGSKYPPTADRLRSVTTLRQALLLYLSLVLRDLPFDSMSCETCRLPDSSYAVVMFDGLQLGYRVKYKKPFHKTEVKIRAVARASLVPSLITDEAVSKAFGAVLSAKQDVVASASSKPITTAASIRGHVMAVEMLLGNVEVNGAEKSFARSKPHMIGGRSNRGWDAVVEGGVAPQLVAF